MNFDATSRKLNRRDVFKTLAGLFGAALVDPTALLSSVRDPLPEPCRLVIPADEGFLIDSLRSQGVRGDCKILLPGEAGFSLPYVANAVNLTDSKLYLPPGTILEMPGESGSLLVLHGISMRQLSPRLNDIDCCYKVYWLDGRRK